MTPKEIKEGFLRRDANACSDLELYGHSESEILRLVDGRSKDLAAICIYLLDEVQAMREELLSMRGDGK
jgi:hypothetical protein